MLQTIYAKDNVIFLLDQRKLPFVTEYIQCTTVEEIAEAIETMVVRGAPLIGITAAYGMFLAALNSQGNINEIKKAKDRLAKTRPTAVNLFWALHSCMKLAQNITSEEERISALFAKAEEILNHDITMNKKMGQFGQELLKDGDYVLTHCNAGALATGGYGTALGVIRAAVEAGKSITVISDETRPRLQGACLTCYELMEDNIDVIMIPDNNAGILMKKGLIQKVIVGADRITRNGDVANKIGTYMVSLAAKDNNIPFYVAAPRSTIDFSLNSGNDIPIEQRSTEEVVKIHGNYITDKKVKAMNYAFDVTPHNYISKIITEFGVFSPENIASLEKK